MLPFLNWFFIGLNLWVFFAWQLRRILRRPKPTSPPSASFPSLSSVNFPLPPTSGPWPGMVYGVYFDVQSRRRLHLLGNMLFLYLFGDNMEDAMGKQGMEFLPFLRTTCRFGSGLGESRLADPDGGASGRFQESWLAIFSSIHGQTPFLLLVFHFHRLGLLARLLALGLLACRASDALPESMQQAGGVAIAAHLGGFGGLGLRLFQEARGTDVPKRIFSSFFSQYSKDALV